MLIKEAFIKWEDGLRFAFPETPFSARKYYEQEVVYDNGTSVYYRRPISECDPAEFQSWVERLAKMLHCRINGTEPSKSMLAQHKQIWDRIFAAEEKEVES